MRSLTRRQFGANIAGSAVAAAMLGGRAFAQGAPVKGGFLNVISKYEPPTLTSIFQNTATAGAGGRVLESLLKVNMDQSLSPYLATAWEFSEEGHQLTFDLRQGVNWHDGEPFKSEDVAFSLFTLRDMNSRRRATLDSLESADTSDPHRLVLNFSRPAPFVLRGFTARASPIFPKHLYEGTDIRENRHNSAPIGTGPYKFATWERGSHYVLERNENYWEPDRPFLDAIIMRFVTDAGSRIAAYETGEVDIGYSTPIPIEEIERLLKDPRFATTTDGYADGGSMNQIFFNLRKAPLNDLRVRKAMAHLINIPDYIRVAWKGQAVSCPTVIARALTEFSDTSIEHYKYDIDEANRLLDEAGLSRGTNGTRFRIRMTHNPYYGELKAGAEFLRSAFTQAGIAVDINTYDYATYIKTVYGDWDFDLDLNGADCGFDPMDGVQRLYWSNGIQKGVPFSNHMGYSDPEVDKLFAEGATTVDPEARRAVYNRLQRKLWEDLPAINLVSPLYTTLFNKRVHDHTTHETGGVPDFVGTWVEA